MIENGTMMRFGLIGAGVIGHKHAETISSLPDATLVAIADSIPGRAETLATEYDAEPHSTSVRLLARDDIDAVAICTPSGSHAGLSVAALNAGKHVVVEKPLDVTVGVARRVLHAEKRTARTVTVISQHRFDKASQLVHDAVHIGRFGRLTSGVASVAWWRGQNYYNSGQWRGTWALDGGGALMNQGIHTIDLLLWMLGEPVEVFAHTARLAHHDIEVEDTVVATIRFASDALGVVHATTAAYPGLSARLQIHGDRGSAIIDADTLVYYHCADPEQDDAAPETNQAPELLGNASTPEHAAGSDPTALSTAHADQYRDFIDAITEHRPPLVTTTAAIQSIAVIQAIYQSARTAAPVPITPA